MNSTVFKMSWGISNIIINVEVSNSTKNYFLIEIKLLKYLISSKINSNLRFL